MKEIPQLSLRHQCVGKMCGQMSPKPLASVLGCHGYSATPARQFAEPVWGLASGRDGP